MAALTEIYLKGFSSQKDLNSRLLKFIPSQKSPKHSCKLGICLRKKTPKLVCHLNMHTSFGCLPYQMRYILIVLAKRGGNNEILIYP